MILESNANKQKYIIMLLKKRNNLLTPKISNKIFLTRVV